MKSIDTNYSEIAQTFAEIAALPTEWEQELALGDGATLHKVRVGVFRRSYREWIRKRRRDAAIARGGVQTTDGMMFTQASRNRRCIMTIATHQAKPPPDG